MNKYLYVAIEIKSTAYKVVMVPFTFAGMKSLIWKCQNLRKTDLANICQIICRKFHQNRSTRLGYSAATHTHTHRRTHIHTHIHTPSVPSQHIQSKWLNIKTQKENSPRGKSAAPVKQTAVWGGGAGRGGRSRTAPAPGRWSSTSSCESSVTHTTKHSLSYHNSSNGRHLYCRRICGEICI